MIKLTEAVKTYLSNVLKVVRSTSNLIISSSTCGSFTVPSADKTTGIANSDLHIYITITNEPSSNYLAYASACRLSSTLNRPVFGYVNFNVAYLADEYLASNFYFKNSLLVTLHEVTHVLGFSSGLYSYWKDRNNNYASYTPYT